jgi:hypothetical protein
MLGIKTQQQRPEPLLFYVVKKRYLYRLVILLLNPGYATPSDSINVPNSSPLTTLPVSFVLQTLTKSASFRFAPWITAFAGMTTHNGCLVFSK